MKRLNHTLVIATLLLASPQALAATSMQWRSDYLHNTTGGLDTGSAHIGQLDAAIEFNSPGLFGKQANWLFSAFYNTGNAYTQQVGDIQVVSNIEADGEGLRLNEAWIEQPLPFGDSSLLIGKYDLNGEFDVLESALPFINSAFGIGTDIGQTGANGPSIFPATGLALRLKFALNDHWSAKIAVMEGVPGDPNDPGETRLRINSEEGSFLVFELALNEAAYRLLGGYWRYSKAPTPICGAGLCGDSNNRNSGLYLRGETRLYAGATGQNIDGFFRIGTAEREYNPLDRFYSVGMLLSSPFTNRNNDKFGFALAYGRTGSDFKQGVRNSGISPASREGVVELTYLAEVSPNLHIQPTIQFVDNPGANRDIKDSWTLGVRLDFTFP